jgi:hypothetical protein
VQQNRETLGIGSSDLVDVRFARPPGPHPPFLGVTAQSREAERRATRCRLCGDIEEVTRVGAESGARTGPTSRKPCAPKPNMRLLLARVGAEGALRAVFSQPAQQKREPLDGAG